jgi:hypothetical protein
MLPRLRHVFPRRRPQRQETYRTWTRIAAAGGFEVRRPFVVPRKREGSSSYHSTYSSNAPSEMRTRFSISLSFGFQVRAARARVLLRPLRSHRLDFLVPQNNVPAPAARAPGPSHSHHTACTPSRKSVKCKCAQRQGGLRGSRAVVRRDDRASANAPFRAPRYHLTPRPHRTCTSLNPTLTPPSQILRF